MATKAGQHERFHIRSLDQLAGMIEELGLELPVSTDTTVLGRELELPGITLANRFAVHPMEGFDAGDDGAPGELSFRRYRRYAAGGFGLIWIEATAVLEEARSNPSQLYIHAGNAEVFRDLVSAIRETARKEHGHDIGIVMQLTHSGRYSKPTGAPEPIIAHRSPILDPKQDLPSDYPVATDEYLDRLQDTYVAAARLAAEAGVNGVDIKSCHRYLVSELLASFTREGKYGGSLENRTRLLRETMSRIREEVPGIFVTTRMNVYDAIEYPYGFGVSQDDKATPDLREPLELISKLKEIGIPVLNASIGNPYFNPHYGRPFDFPIAGMTPPETHPLAGIAMFVGITRQLQQANPDLPVVGGGYSWLRNFMPNVGAGVIEGGGATIMGIGRGAFAYPDTPNDVLSGKGMDPHKCCVACSACTQIMRDGGQTGCVVRDKEIYGPRYRLARRFALDRLQEAARRCRDCENAMCTKGCPAAVDVPAFIKAFAESDFEEAYNILRKKNRLPEMCAYVCPSEVQCEGGCLEDIFCENPVPIRDIQLVTCQIARRAGKAGVVLPDKPNSKSVAVVGGGPAGVAAAIRLLELGYEVHVHEAGTRLGGTPDSVIPGTRYQHAGGEIDAILKPAIEAGRVKLNFGSELGRNVSLDELRRKHDAVILAMGLQGAASIGDADGVEDAMSFLRRIKLSDDCGTASSVAVLGGGNTAIDAAILAKEKGAQDVYLVYRRSFREMPAWPGERKRLLESGVHVMILSQPMGYETGPDGKLKGVRVARTELGAPDASGRRRPQVVSGTEYLLQVDHVVEALGQKTGEALQKALEDVAFEGNGFIKRPREGSFVTTLDDVYAVGDIVNGGTTAVQGVADGTAAAEEIGSRHHADNAGS